MPVDNTSIISSAQPKEERNYLRICYLTGIINIAGSAIITAVFLPLFIKQAGMEIYGQWALLFFFTGFAGLFDLGLSKSLVYLIPKEKTQNNINKLFTAGLLINTCLIIFVMLAGFILLSLDLNIWGTSNAFSKDIAHLLFFNAIVILALSLATQFCRSLLEASNKVYIINIGFLLLTILNYVPAYIVSMYSINIKTLSYCLVGSTGVILLFHVASLIWFAKFRIILPSNIIFLSIIKASSRFISIGLLIITLIPISRYSLLYISDNTNTYAQFDIALKIALMATSLLAVFTTPLLSIFSRYGRDNIHKINNLIRKTTLITALAYIGGILLYSLIGKELIVFLFNVESHNIIYMSSLVLLLGFGINGVCEPYYRALIGVGSLKLAWFSKCLLIITNVSLIILLHMHTPLQRISYSLAIANILSASLLVLSFNIIANKKK